MRKQPPPATFATRQAEFIARDDGADVVDDIAFLAEHARVRTGYAFLPDAKDWLELDGDGRVFWAVTVGAVVEAAGLTFDQYVAMARAHLRAAGKEAA